MAQVITCDTMGCTAENVHEVFDGVSTFNLCDVHAALMQVNGKLAYVAKVAVTLHDINDFTFDFGEHGTLSTEKLLRVCELAAEGLEARHHNLEEAAAMEERVLRDG
jgi:hypothetical protein